MNPLEWSSNTFCKYVLLGMGAACFGPLLVLKFLAFRARWLLHRA